MYKTPADLEEEMQRNRARVPSLGLGFKKVALDPAIHQELLTHFWANTGSFKPEDGSRGLKSESDGAPPSLIYSDHDFNRKMGEKLKPAHEAWSGRPLVGTSCYGIRVYQPGSFLYPHVDTIETHVVSSTICVDQHLNKPWPLYIEDDDGNPHEISMEPGEMVFYESALLPHGRPYALDGKFYAGVFVHFAPLDWKLNS